MKKLFLILLPLLFMFASCEETFFDPRIDSAEFDGNFKTIIVHYEFAPRNPDVQVRIYKNTVYEDYSTGRIDKFDYNAFKSEKTAKIILSEEVPEKSKVRILPADGNNELSGYFDLYRK